MKKILFFLFVLFFPNFVLAEDILLKELNINNGELSLPFDSYNTEYTVTLDETEFHLDFLYVVDDNVIVSINNNHDLENNSKVTLTVLKDKELLEYHFHILKPEKENIAVFKEQVNVENNSFMFKYKIYIIPAICLILIIICYKILFRKHKKRII